MPAQSHASRRLFLAAGSAATVFGALSQAAAVAVTDDDPIFTAIDRHRFAWRALSQANDGICPVLAKEHDRKVSKADQVLYAAADKEESEALDALLGTAPTSKAGIRAAIEYLSEFDVTGFPDNLAAFHVSLLRSPVLADLGVRS